MKIMIIKFGKFYFYLDQKKTVQNYFSKDFFISKFALLRPDRMSHLRVHCVMRMNKKLMNLHNIHFYSFFTNFFPLIIT